MIIHLHQAWMWFCLLSGIALALSLLMGRLGEQLLTRDGSLRQFSIIDLEFPSNNLDIPNIINGIYRLPDTARIPVVIRALKRQLYVDYLFMPAVYGAVFILCMQVAGKFADSHSIGARFFAALAWLQAIAWLCDIVENIFLLRSIHDKLEPASKIAHWAFVRIVWIKWGIVMTGLVNATMLILYYWMKGTSSTESKWHMGIFAAELIVFMVIAFRLKGKKKAVK